MFSLKSERLVVAGHDAVKKAAMLAILGELCHSLLQLVICQSELVGDDGKVAGAAGDVIRVVVGIDDGEAVGILVGDCAYTALRLVSEGLSEATCAWLECALKVDERERGLTLWTYPGGFRRMAVFR